MKKIKKYEIVVTTNYIEDWYPNGLAGVFVALKEFDIEELYDTYMETHDEDDDFENALIENGYVWLAPIRHISVYGKIEEEQYITGWYEDVKLLPEGERYL